jgi:hypothetical protein
VTLLQVALFLLTALGGAAVVLTRKPHLQVLVLALHGLILVLLFMVLQAFAQLAVGAAALPLMFFAALVSMRAKDK